MFQCNILLSWLPQTLNLFLEQCQCFWMTERVVFWRLNQSQWLKRVTNSYSLFPPPAFVDFLHRDGVHVWWVSLPVTLGSEAGCFHVAPPPNNTAVCGHGFQPPSTVRGVEGRLSLSTVPEGPSDLLPTQRPLRRRTLWGRPSRQGSDQEWVDRSVWILSGVLFTLTSETFHSKFHFAQIWCRRPRRPKTGSWRGMGRTGGRLAPTSHSTMGVSTPTCGSLRNWVRRPSRF